MNSVLAYSSCLQMIFPVVVRRNKQLLIQGNHAIAKMTARCAQYVSALKIVGLCKRKTSR